MHFRGASLLAAARTPDALVLAYRSCRAAARARDRAAFDRAWPARMARIQRALAAGHLPATAGRRRFAVRRHDGSLRQLEAPALAEAIGQRAVLNAITPVLERTFLPCSYAYRPGRDRVDAARSASGWIAGGYTHAFQADIASCFDEIEHTRLLRSCRTLLHDRPLQRLLARWLETVGAPRASGRWPWRRRHKVGLPQGAVLSPALANVYLHALDRACVRAGLRYVRYGDDLLVLARSRRAARRAAGFVTRQVQRLGLRLSPTKTCIASAEGLSFLGLRLPVALPDGRGTGRAFASTTYFLRRTLATKERGTG